MDLKIITPIFTIGKLLALTPSTTKNLSPTSFQKLYSILVFLFYICGTTLSFVNRKSHYSKLSVMQLVLRVLLDVDLFVHSFYTVIVVGLFKRHQWIIIITKLETVQYENDNERRYYSTFVVSHLVLLLVTDVCILRLDRLFRCRFLATVPRGVLANVLAIFSTHCRLVPS
jgi:hypothetical protein